VKLDWFAARSALRESNPEAILILVERQFDTEIDRQYEIKLVPHGWEEIVVCVGPTLTTYKISDDGWTTWQWWPKDAQTESVRHAVYKKQIIIYGPKQ